MGVFLSFWKMAEMAEITIPWLWHATTGHKPVLTADLIFHYTCSLYLLFFFTCCLITLNVSISHWFFIIGDQETLGSWLYNQVKQM